MLPIWAFLKLINEKIVVSIAFIVLIIILFKHTKKQGVGEKQINTDNSQLININIWSGVLTYCY